MKFIVSSSTLLKHLQSIGGVINSSNALPILENFLFEIEGNNLKVSASDLETTVSATLTVESKDSGNIAIPARLLVDTLKTFSEQPLTFSIDKKKNAIEISSDYGKYKLAGHNGDEYPKIPVIENPSTFMINGSITKAFLLPATTTFVRL